MITNGFTYIAVLAFIAASLVGAQKLTKSKFFEYVPPVVLLYLVGMVCCTFGVWNTAETKAAYSAVRNPILYAMIFLMLLRCDIRQILKLGPKMLLGFFTASVSIAIGFIATYAIMNPVLDEGAWRGLGALCGSWMGGSGNLVAVSDALQATEAQLAGASIVDSIDYSIWVMFLLWAINFAPKFNKWAKADTSKLDEVAKVANAEVASTKKSATAADWIFLIGLSLIVSVLSQKAGAIMDKGLCAIGLDMFGAATCTTVFVTVLGLVCAVTPLGKLAAVEELSSIYLYTVVSLLASRATLVDLVAAPMWIVYGFVILAIHVVLMFVLSKVFKWDLCMVSTASLANIGGSASAPIVATAYDPNFAGIGVLMGVLGAAIGNFCGLGMGAILQFFA